MGRRLIGATGAWIGRGAEEDFTEFKIRIPTANRYINFGNVMGLATGPADLRIDWGDGLTDSRNTWESQGTGFQYCYATSSGPAPIGHTYATPGNYTIKMYGNVTLTAPYPSTATAPGMTDVIVSYKCKRINYYSFTNVHLGSSLSPIFNWDWDQLDSLDFSQCYEDPPGTTVRTVPYPLGTTTSTTTIQYPRYIKWCRNVGYLSLTFLRNNTGVRVIEFPDKTMAQVRAFKSGTSATSQLWNFQYFPTACEIVCTDGTIRYTNGAWTDFPANQGA